MTKEELKVFDIPPSFCNGAFTAKVLSDEHKKTHCKEVIKLLDRLIQTHEDEWVVREEYKTLLKELEQ